MSDIDPTEQVCRSFPIECDVMSCKSIEMTGSQEGSEGKEDEE